MWSCCAGVRWAPASSDCDWVPIGTHGIKGIAEIRRGPQDCGVGDQGQAEGLIHLVVEVAAADVALVGEEQIAAPLVVQGAKSALRPAAEAAAARARASRTPSTTTTLADGERGWWVGR